MAVHDILPGYWLRRRRTVERDHSDHVAGETDFSSLFGNQPIWFGDAMIFAASLRGRKVGLPECVSIVRGHTIW